MLHSRTAKTSQPARRRPIAKSEKDSLQTTSKHSKSKLQRKRSHSKAISDIEHAFRIHHKEVLYEMECLMSLKLLGWVGDNPDAMGWFETMWRSYGEDGGMGESGFRSMVSEARNSPYWQSYSQVGELLGDKRVEQVEVQQIPSILRLMNALS